MIINNIYIYNKNIYIHTFIHTYAKKQKKINYCMYLPKSSVTLLFFKQCVRITNVLYIAISIPKLKPQTNT